MLLRMQVDWPRFGNLVRERRTKLGVRRGDGGLSRTTWRKIEKAVDPPYRYTTVRLIFRALDWRVDSIDDVLAGGDPVTGEDYEAELRRRVDELEARLAAADSEPDRREAG